MSYKLDDEFRAYMRPLNDAEREELRASIKEEGVRDSLVVWVGRLESGCVAPSWGVAT